MFTIPNIVLYKLSTFHSFNMRHNLTYSPYDKGADHQVFLKEMIPVLIAC